MTSQSTNESSVTEHNHYYPDGMIPVTPQARDYGYTMDVGMLCLFLCNPTLYVITFLFTTNDFGILPIQDGDRRFNVAPRQEEPIVLSSGDIKVRR